MIRQMILIKNKKAQEEGLELIFIPLIIILFLILALVSFEALTLFKNERKLTIENINAAEDEILLMNYLRSNVTYNNHDIKMFQLLSTKNKSEIELNTRKIMESICEKNKIFKKNQCFWDMTIKYNDEELHYSGGSRLIAIAPESYTNTQIKFHDFNNNEISIKNIIYRNE